MSFEEACLYCAAMYGSIFSYTGNKKDFFICPKCDNPVFRDDYNDESFSKCSICSFSFRRRKQ